MSKVLQWFADARSNRLFALTLAVALGVIFVDQATKLWILHGLELPSQRGRTIDLSPVFDLTYVENRGVSFGLFAGGHASRILLSILAIGVAGFVLHWAGRLDRRVAAIGAGFIVGGALGNAYDRVAYGFVVEFFDFYCLYLPLVFNSADVAVNFWVAFLSYDAFVVMPKREASEESVENQQKNPVGGVRPPPHR
ncbi:MAG: signal peptidase II, partial [Pseudomonadota bacterium]